MTIRTAVDRVLSLTGRGLEWFFEHVGTFMYREMLKRNTLQPMQNIIRASTPEMQHILLCEWAQKKSSECAYIQLAGGFLFTTVASCLQWPSVQTGHWSGAALLYASILLSLAAIVSGSQQLLVLPSERQRHVLDNNGHSQPLPQQLPSQPSQKPEAELDELEKDHLRDIAERFGNTARTGRPNTLHVFALQAPIMLLALAVLAFFAGLCSVVFAPLAIQPEWNDNAKIAVVFGTAGILCIMVFLPTSFLMHGLFSLQHEPQSRVSSFLTGIKA